MNFITVRVDEIEKSVEILNGVKMGREAKGRRDRGILI